MTRWRHCLKIYEMYGFQYTAKEKLFLFANSVWIKHKFQLSFKFFNFQYLKLKVNIQGEYSKDQWKFNIRSHFKKSTKEN